MILNAPHMLWLLLLVPLVIAAHGLHRTTLRRGRIGVVALLRALGVAALIVALAGPILSLRRSRICEIAVVDVSPSITDEDLDAARRRLDARWGVARAPAPAPDRHLILFDREARVADLAVLQREVSTWRTATKLTASDAGSALADALDTAAAMIPPGATGRIVLFTDGLATGADAGAAAVRLSRRGIALDVQHLGRDRSHEVVLVRAHLPAASGMGSTVPLRLLIDSSQAGLAAISVESLDAGGPPKQVSLSLIAGRHEHIIPLEITRPGHQRFKVRCTGPDDTVTDNNERIAATLVTAPYPTYVLENDPQQRATEALKALLGSAALVESLPAAFDADQLNRAALLVLADMPARDIPADTQKRICQAVSNGMGLLVSGGRQSFGPGGYEGTALADIIPVDFSQQIERRDPSVAMVIIIDTSGSMTGPRIALAKEVARLAVRRLQAHDKVGVVEFYGTKRWAARIQSAANAIDINRALNRLSAGGGTVILPAIEEAYYALLGVQTRFRHVLIVTDGGVETGPFQEIITKMADAGMTASTVMVGPGQHSTFLSSLAHWGRGRFYSAPDRFHLPEVILKQPEQLLASPYREQPSRLAAPLAGDSVLEGVELPNAPVLNGYVSVIAPPQADVLLRAEAGDPVLTRWRHGRGFAAAWMSDLGGEWSSDLARWPGMATLLSNLGRQITRTPAEVKIDPVVRAGGIELRLTCPGYMNASVTMSPVELICTSPSGEEQTRRLMPVAPGQWNEFVVTSESGSHEFAASINEGAANGAGMVERNPDQEISAVNPDRAVLDRLSRLASQAATIPSASEGAGARVNKELWPWLVILAMICMLLQLLVRRMPVRRTPAPLAALLAAMLFAAPAGRAHAATVATQPADTAYERSQAAAWEGDFDAARRILEASLPGDTAGDLHAGMAQWLELQGDDAAAIGMLQQAVALRPNAPESLAWRTRLGILLLDTGQSEQGCRVLHEAAQLGGSPEYRRFCANLEVIFGQPAAALALQTPATADARELLVESLAARRAGRFEATEQLCRTSAQKAFSRPDQRFALQQWVAVARQRQQLDGLATLLLNQPDATPDQLHVLAGLLRELNRVDDLISLLEKSSTRATGRVDALDLSELQEQVVAAAVETGKYGAAVRVLESLAARSPGELKWRISLARLHLLHGSRDDARRPLGEAIAAATQPADLFSLADAARDLALDDVALLAVDQAARTNDSAAFQAGLWRAHLAEKHGDAGRAVAELEKVVSLAKTDPARLRELAEAFEQYQQPARAIELTRQLLQQTKDEDAQLRLAWLLEQTQQTEAARDLWRDIWETTTTPALANQAAGRLLELAAKTGTIADLAIAIEDKLGQGRASPRELNLLVDLYTQINDDLSASEILFTFARQSGDEIASLRQLARAYLRMGRLAQADTILQRLAAADPANEMEFQQERTVLAVERQRPEDAIAAIERMTQLGNDTTVVEMSAGVYSLLGDHERAARSYERVLVSHPQEIELWLLWANSMRDAGQAAQAIRRLQVLTNQAEQDDLFLVAVDGLLNLDAGGTPLKVALRRLLERIAAGPQKIFLYDAAADVMDTLALPGRINPLMEQALIFAGEQRGSLLREMMERAKADNRKDLHIDYGALLVGLGYDVPPQVLIDLGETFLAQQRRAEAERAFARAGSLGDYATVRRKVADAYDRALLPQPAQQITAELLVTDPDNVGLLHRNAGLLEQLGRYDEAFGGYERALRLLVGRMPRFRVATSSSAPAETGPRRVQRVAANLDETTQFYEPMVDSLVACARTDASKDRVVQLLLQIADDELKARQSMKEGRTLAQFPRLKSITESLRGVAISLHKTDLAEQTDRKLLAAFPNDLALSASLVEQWIAWGLGDRAAALAAAAAAKKQPPKIAAQALRDALRALAPFLNPDKKDAPVVRQLAPLLVMDARIADVRRLMDRCRVPGTALDLETTRILLTTSVALGDAALTADWLAACIDACKTTPDGDRLAAAVTQGIRLGWNVLNADQRQGAMAALDRLAGHYSPRSIRVDLLRLQLAPDALGPEQRRAILLQGAKLAAGDERAIIQVLQWVRPEERLPVVEQAWTTAKPAQQLDLLLAIAGAWSWPADQDVLDGFNRLLDACPAVRLDKFSPYGSLTRSAWHRNDKQPALGEVIAEHLLSQLKLDASVQTAAACALATAGRHDRAVELARSAWAALLANRKLEPEHERMIDDLVAGLPYAQAKTIIVETPSTRPADDASVVEMFAKAKVDARGEQEPAAIDGFARTLRRATSNETVRRTLIDYLQQTGRLSQLPPFFEPYLADRSVVQAYELGRIADAYRQMGRPADALRVFSYDSGTLSAIRTLELEAMLGRTDRLQLILRRFLVTNRLERRFYTPLAARPPGVGGMNEYLARTQADAPRSFGLFNLLAGIEPIVPEFEALWQSATPDRRDVPGLVEAIAQAATARGAPANLLRAFESWAKAGSLHARDMALLTWLIVRAHVELSPDVARVLRDKLSWVDADQVDALETRARLCLQSADARGAQAVLRWTLAVDLAQGRNLLDSAAPLRRIDLYLACVPAADKAAEARRVTTAWMANPLEEPNDRLDALVLQRMAQIGDESLARSALSADLHWLERMSSRAFMPRLERACARFFFEAGDTKSAMQHVAALVRLCRTTYGETHPLDAMQFLPPADRLKHAPATVEAIAQLIDATAKRGDLSPTHATRSLALLGQWCVAQKLMPLATATLEQARAAAGPTPCERWLWVMDLARQIDPGEAARLEMQLQEAALLPAARTPKKQGSAPS